MVCVLGVPPAFGEYNVNRSTLNVILEPAGHTSQLLASFSGTFVNVQENITRFEEAGSLGGPRPDEHMSMSSPLGLAQGRA